MILHHLLFLSFGILAPLQTPGLPYLKLHLTLDLSSGRSCEIAAKCTFNLKYCGAEREDREGRAENLKHNQNFPIE